MEDIFKNQTFRNEKYNSDMKNILDGIYTVKEKNSELEDNIYRNCPIKYNKQSISLI